MSALLGLSEEEVISEAPQDENERILDYTTRQEIHQTLLKLFNYIILEEFKMLVSMEMHLMFHLDLCLVWLQV